MSPLTEVFVFLLLGHTIGDFLLQSSKLAARKRTSQLAILQHLGVLAVTHIVALVPVFLHEDGIRNVWLWILPAVLVTHGVIDAAKAAIEHRHGESLQTFLLDQALHLLCLFGAASAAAPGDFWDQPLPWSLTRFAVLVSAYSLTTVAGSAIVRLTLARYHPLERSDSAAEAAANDDRSMRMGHAIGVLERSLGLTLVLLGSWTGLAGIIAAKSIARFKALEERRFGEYYLIGTLTSLLITIAIGAVTLLLLNQHSPS